MTGPRVSTHTADTEYTWLHLRVQAPSQTLIHRPCDHNPNDASVCVHTQAHNKKTRLWDSILAKFSHFLPSDYMMAPYLWRLKWVICFLQYAITQFVCLNKKKFKKKRKIPLEGKNIKHKFNIIILIWFCSDHKWRYRRSGVMQSKNQINFIPHLNNVKSFFLLLAG